MFNGVLFGVLLFRKAVALFIYNPFSIRNSELELLLVEFTSLLLLLVTAEAIDFFSLPNKLDSSKVGCSSKHLLEARSNGLLYNCQLTDIR